MDWGWMLLIALALGAIVLLVFSALISIEKKTIEMNDPWD